MSNIKVGATLYCWTNEYATGNMSFRDIVKAAAKIGCEGYEIVATQMIPSYPHVSDAFLAEVNRLKDETGIGPVSYGANCDRGMLPDRNLTEDEMLNMAIVDVQSAHKLGCHVMRAQYLMGPNVLERLEPYARMYDVKVGIEIHNPETPSTPVIREYEAMMERVGSPYIGFVPDFGCFATKPNKPYWDAALAAGAPLELLEMAAQMRYDDVPMEEAQARLAAAGANGAVFGAFSGMYGFVQFSKNPDFEGLKRIMKHCVHFHGKFHYLYENGEEASIPYDDVVSIIRDSDFEGFIVAENENHSGENTTEMTRRCVDKIKRVIGR
jgi:sugar phosphate isomerase/epimerase